VPKYLHIVAMLSRPKRIETHLTLARLGQPKAYNNAYQLPLLKWGLFAIRQ
jgi:hypothetical protein